MAPPGLGTQNQVADFILADPELRAAGAHWGRYIETDEATTAPPRRLPCDAAYRRIRAYLEPIMVPGPGKSHPISADFRLPGRYIGRKCHQAEEAVVPSFDIVSRIELAE